MSVFYSYHYEWDHWRAHQVSALTTIENTDVIHPEIWDEIRYWDEVEIRDWIDQQLNDKSAVVVLIGQRTHQRDWIRYEIKRAWEQRIPLLGIMVYGLKDRSGQPGLPGENPFLFLGDTEDVPIFDPTIYEEDGSIDSAATLSNLAIHLPSWIKQGATRW